MKSNDFDGIAKYYDRLAKLIYGDAINNAQIHFLNELPFEGKVLIIGGGSGWILKEIAKLHPNIEIDYVEASSKMMVLAKDVCPEHLNVRFILGTEYEIPETIYDSIITNFFLDVFNDVQLAVVMEQLKSKLKKGGIWLCADFQKTGKWYQMLLIKLMHFFFRTVANLDANSLNDFDKEFKRFSFYRKRTHYFFNRMIFSSVYCLTSQ